MFLQKLIIYFSEPVPFLSILYIFLRTYDSIFSKQIVVCFWVKHIVLNKVSYNWVLQLIATYLYIFVACAVNHDIFYIMSKHDYVMSKPFISKIPPCPDMEHTHCHLAQTLSVIVKARCQAAAFDENNLFPYIRTYIHTLDQRVAIL